MIITITKDDGTEQTFADVVTAYVAVQQVAPYMDNQNVPMQTLETRSYSYGNNIREVAKELAQSLHEIQVILDRRAYE